MKIQSATVSWKNLDGDKPEASVAKVGSPLNLRGIESSVDDYLAWLKATGREDNVESVRAFCECGGALSGELPKFIHG